MDDLLIYQCANWMKRSSARAGRAGNASCTSAGRMKRAAVWSILAGITALVLAIIWAGARDRNSTGIDEAQPGDAPIGTAGYQTPSDSEDSPATIHDLETMTGAIDPHELIGGRVDFHLKDGEVRDGT